MAYSDGEYIEKYLIPQLLHDVQNNKADFLNVVQNAPARALSKSGIMIHKVGNPISVDWNRTTPYSADEMKRFDIGNKTIPWEYFSSSPFETDKEEIRQSVHNPEGVLRMKSREAINQSFRDKALFNLAPEKDDAGAPVIQTTGPERENGNKRMLVEDMIIYAEKINKLSLTRRDMVYIVLTPEHLTDLQLDALNYQHFKDIYARTATGEPINQHGFKFFWNNETIMYNAAGVKKPIGSAAAPGDRPGSVSFYAPHAIKALYNLSTHHSPASEDTVNNPPKSTTRFTGNALVAATYKYGHGAIISGK